MDSRWRKITVDTREEMDTWLRVLDGFTKLFTAALAPRDAGMFSRSQPGMAEVELLFSPGAYRIARTLIDENGAVPCEKPPKEGTVALVCHAAGPSPLD